MYTALIVMIFIFAIGVYSAKDDGWGIMIFAGIISIIFGFFIGLFVAFVIGCFQTKSIESVVKIPIYAGFNSNVLFGSGFLFSARLDEKDTVFYWIKTSDGALKKENIDMKDVVFYEEARTDGELVDIQHTCVEDIRWYTCEPDHQYSFHVPYKSIFTGFEYK
jgi:hypothetical protein